MTTELQDKVHDQISRRTFLQTSGIGLGAAAVSTILPSVSFATEPSHKTGPHFTPKVKRVIYLHQSGAPSQLETFDYKPKLESMWGQNLPESVRGGQRLTGMSAGQSSFPLAASTFKFAQYGKSRAWVSDLLPYHKEVVDDLCFVKSMYTEHINHDPAITFIQTGNQIGGRPSMGSWMSYGLGSENQNLPAFVVLLSRGRTGDQPLYAKLWSNGFIPSVHQGVVFRSGPDPVYYLNNPNGIDKSSRRNMLKALSKLSEDQYKQVLDPELNSRMLQYEMAYRMQSSVPETLDIKNEPDYIFDMYGADSRIPGTYAANCLLARKLAEKDVRFIQLYHQGWDQHGNLPKDIQTMAKSVDQASVALIKDLKQRGLLDDTLVVWGGEFGRTNYSQGKLTKENYGRDHHPRCFTIYMTGGGVKKGFSLGQTDEFGYNIVKDPVHIHDLQATIMHLMGIDHEQLTYKFQGRRYRLTDVAGKVIKPILV
ncbi:MULTISPECIES: DUF1501 domain-containing protein [unclassified Arcicella]|uniref:DUF1501 domain-containing protein n=1 Tax=unclassified Arcicella TaxID=2644986 RepID=UPI002862D20E|nr:MULTISPECIES: DUF1501 domain-containing protein [unclassified Arcicella]MDR6562130.1 hypothetical protein [Arcicella sp. BE51]MDR6812175.1 hypothetical protein [Arcicella sp. BE140]MDR6823487.1 hypothetical protein [Arcicella sp. BE139]